MARWSEAEDCLIEDHYPDQDQDFMALALPGRSYSAIACRAYGLGVPKSKKRLAAMGRASMDKVRAKFGDEYWRKPIGATHNRGRYTAVKVAEPDTWVPLHNYTWEQVNGPIPEGLIVAAIDGNLRNVAIGNLCLRSFGENQIRYRYKRFPSEIVDILHLQNELKKIIKKRIDHEE
ncbi:HNH endonuclease signature motif containing protein [Pseudomonas sp. 10B1]|uniref:HNH endonuclease signature motif containing protein n=1 Tax=unclassified Pseudomonas TaxID=196821 RepID=UPI002B22586E|nr:MULTISPECIES: HNH endonuclease signature motif containing protein [unclassified Pseudomonas]MEA9994283.1 HNH endonuclease signature motif containing protein [Pseudomonas sp. AA4]MEB0088540.1 HNH endonuclease signature motif containing protein [Pseudomonas sp. RTI1]MEB0126537.1 HNH endonuclease signature motif containing protein [Pseudomonas sp. CCC1.2]MEB0154650.1 HNH endonuclease signature motif containing protein [Pseudomonas sp. CCC4.3]MEB0221133.1 HNH endonuclease signature motif contai